MKTCSILGAIVGDFNFFTFAKTFSNLGFGLSAKENFGSNFKCYVSNIVQVCQSLGKCILAMEQNSQVFNEAFKPLVDVDEPFNVGEHTTHGLDPYSLPKKQPRRILDYE